MPEEVRFIERGGRLVVEDRQVGGAPFGQLAQAFNEMSSNLKTTVEAISTEKTKLVNILANMADSIIMTDVEGDIILANPAAGKLFGFDFKNSRYKPIAEIIEPAKNKFVEFLCQSRQSKAYPVRREFEFKQQDRSLTFDCVISCVYDEDGQVCGIVAVLHMETMRSGCSASLTMEIW